jgi:hypothetical protein
MNLESGFARHRSKHLKYAGIAREFRLNRVKVDISLGFTPDAPSTNPHAQADAEDRAEALRLASV